MYQKAGKAVAAIVSNPSKESYLQAGKAFAAAENDLIALHYLHHAALLAPHRGTTHHELGRCFGRLANDQLAVKYLLVAALVEESVPAWEELVRVARRYVNVGGVGVALRVVMGVVLWVEQRKNVGVRDAVIGELVKAKLGKDSCEIVSLLFVYLKVVKKVDYSFGEHANLLYGSARVLYDYCFERPMRHVEKLSPASPINIVINNIIKRKQSNELPWTIIDSQVLVKHFSKVKELILSQQLRVVITLPLLRDLDEIKGQQRGTDELGRQVMQVMLYLDSLASQPSPSIMFQSVHCKPTKRYRSKGTTLNHGELHDAIMYYGQESFSNFQNNETVKRYEIWTENVELLRSAADFGVYCSRHYSVSI